MTIVTPLIVPLGLDSWSLSWTGTANRVVRVFVNGLLAYGPVLVATATKVVTLGLPSPATIEAHENLVGETVGVASVPLERRPLIWWRTSPGAANYRIYLDDVVRAVVTAQPSLLHQQLVLGADVRVDAGVWRTLRVAAVSADDVEASAAPAFLFVPGLPLTEPTSVTITGGAGEFDIEVTP